MSGKSDSDKACSFSVQVGELERGPSLTRKKIISQIPKIYCTTIKFVKNIYNFSYNIKYSVR